MLSACFVQIPKLIVRVRFSSPAPRQNPRSAAIPASLSLSPASLISTGHPQAISGLELLS
jgi:hypothetical protein